MDREDSSAHDPYMGISVTSVTQSPKAASVPAAFMGIPYRGLPHCQLIDGKIPDAGWLHRLDCRAVATDFLEMCREYERPELALFEFPEHRWAAIIWALHRHPVPNTIRREVLHMGWHCNSAPIRQAFPNRMTLAKIFRQAQFPLPADMPDVVPVWRGVRNLHPMDARVGLSWTTRRDFACLFSHATELGSDFVPLVVRAEIPKDQIVYWSNFVGEHEVIPLEPPEVVEVDGTRDEWEREADTANFDLCALQHQRRDACEAARLQSLAPTDPNDPRFPLWRYRVMNDPRWRSPWQMLVHAVMPRYRLDPYGIHGPAHWLRVAETGKALAALTEGADPMLVECFAILHDSCRITDNKDTGHGERAAAFAEELFDRERLPLLDGAQLRTLMRACAEHEHGTITDDPTIAVCWDSDRLELSRFGRRPIDALLSTAAARDADVQAAAWERGQSGAIDLRVARAWGLNPSALKP